MLDSFRSKRRAWSRPPRAESFSRVVAVVLGCVMAGGAPVHQLQAQEAQRTGRQLTLAEALEIAEQRSEAVGIARAGLSRAEGEKQQARSPYFPQVSGSASYQRVIESQFSGLSSGTDTATVPAPVCNRFVPQPGLPTDQRLDSLEQAVACASAADPFAAFSNLPFGRPNNYRFGLSASQVLFSGGQVRGRAQAA